MEAKHAIELLVEWEPIDSLKPYPGNARVHTRHHERQIAESIRVFGFTNPVLIDKDNQILAGHGRVKGAKRLSMSHVPVIRLENLTEDQIRAYVIADNKLAENSHWEKVNCSRRVAPAAGARIDPRLSGRPCEKFLSRPGSCGSGSAVAVRRTDARRRRTIRSIRRDGGRF